MTVVTYVEVSFTNVSLAMDTFIIFQNSDETNGYKSQTQLIFVVLNALAEDFNFLMKN